VQASLSSVDQGGAKRRVDIVSYGTPRPRADGRAFISPLRFQEKL
jgi:hypothetical protein